MDVTTSADTPAVARVLVVADWAVDPHGIVAACHRRAAEDEARFAVVVPAWLHGLDWAGDPHASRPCAARQLEALTRSPVQRGSRSSVRRSAIPIPCPQIDDFVAGYGATEILLCTKRRRLGHPFDLVHRARRASADGPRGGGRFRRAP